MSDSSGKKLVHIELYSDLNQVPLKFSIRCCNTKKDFTYDLEDFPKKYIELTRAFSWAILAARNSVGHETRGGYLNAIRKFYFYLNILSNIERPRLPRQVDTALLRQYAQWLRLRCEGTYNSKASWYRALGAQIGRWCGRAWAAEGLVFPANQFPNSQSTAIPHKSFSDSELNQIITALKIDLEDSKLRLEQTYINKYLGEPAPLDGVAPFNESLPLQFQHDIWHSKEYQIWWWENNCGCERLTVGEIVKVSRGSTFLRSLWNSWKRRNGIKRGTTIQLKNFYDEINAGKQYSPKYIGMPSPILYSSRWKKMEYLQWYWENHCNSSFESYATLLKKYPRFIKAVREHHGSMVPFYDFIGITHQITLHDLAPYYIGLLLSTGLNPSTIQRLEINCLVPDPLDSDRLSIKWKKLRARSEGKTIPIKRLNGLSPVSLVENLIAATSPFRSNGQQMLFITNGANTGSKKGHHISKAMFERAVQRWFEKHSIVGMNALTGIVEPTTAQGVRFRPTIAQHEYKRTGELGYVKAILGHSRSEMTTAYLNKSGDPVLRHRRGIHLQALFIGITSNQQDAHDLIYQHGMAPKQARDKVIRPTVKESSVAHCRDPLASPVYGQRKGSYCNAHDACLYCENLVVTPYDLTRYFSFVRYHDHLLKLGKIIAKEYDLVVSERKYMFENYVLPRYSTSLVEIAFREAINNPTGEWKFDEDSQ
jgi:hypothetical protein